MRTTSRIIPTLRYEDAAAAVEWLGEAFGFAVHLSVPEGDAGVAHAQLVLGESMIMIGPSRDDAFGRLQSTPKSAGGVVTQSAYVIVDDADAHHDRALAAGAEIVYPLTDEPYGGRGYSCRDLEGHLWNFGTYDPWSEA